MFNTLEEEQFWKDVLISSMRSVARDMDPYTYQRAIRCADEAWAALRERQNKP